MLWFLTALSTTAIADSGDTNTFSSARLADMSIEQLVNFDVISLTSLFKKETKL